jgi:glycerol-3-phosphate O-acyltransferase
MQRFSDGAEDPEVEDEQKRFVQKLGFQILRDVNAVAVVGATSLSATVLLSSPRGARRHDEFSRFSHILAELLRWKGVTFTTSLERNLASGSFAEITSFLASAKLVEEVFEEGVRELRVPPEKRKVLDFYKNNSIHFFLLPALVAHAILRQVPRRDLEEEIWWWLDLFRWEFPLPEREEVTIEAARIVDYLRAHGAGWNGPGAHVPLVHALVGILENFREGYWIVARTAANIEEPLPQARFLQRLRRYFDAAMLLGEVVKHEAASDQSFSNAISRLVEMGCLARETRRGEKDVWLGPGPAFESLPGIADRIGAALTVARETTLHGGTELSEVAPPPSRLSA